MLPRFARRQQAVKHRAVHGHHSVHVFGRLHAAFDFQRRHLGIQQLVQQIDAAQILRGKQMLARCGKRLAHGLVLELVRQTARLSARSAVGRAPANHGRHVALPGIAHAQRAVAEDFGLHSQAFRFGRKQRDLLQRQLARQRDARRTQAVRRLHAGKGMRVHLR